VADAETAIGGSIHTRVTARLVAEEMRVIDAHLARGASDGGATLHNQGGPYGRTNGAKRIVGVDVTGLPLGVRCPRLDVRGQRRRTDT
jgi:hypothetical protein